MSEYYSPNTTLMGRLPKILERYQQNSGERLWVPKHEAGSRHLKGDSMNPKELIPVEEALQNGLTSVRKKRWIFLKMLKKNHQQQLAMEGNMRELELGYHQKERDYVSQMPTTFHVQPIQPNLQEAK